MKNPLKTAGSLFRHTHTQTLNVVFGAKKGQPCLFRRGRRVGQFGQCPFKTFLFEDTFPNWICHCFQTLFSDNNWIIYWSPGIPIWRYICQRICRPRIDKEEQEAGNRTVVNLCQCWYVRRCQNRDGCANLGILSSWGPGRGTERLGKWTEWEWSQPWRGAWVNVCLQQRS